MLTDVLIKNFKCFKNLIIPEFSRVTLVSGRNNVGKTALLEALFLILDRQRPDMILRQYGWRGIEGVITEPESMWAPIFFDHDLDTKILIAVTIDGKTEEAKFEYNPNFIPPTAPSALIQPHQNRQIPTDKEFAISFSLDIEYSRGNGEKQISHLTIDSHGKPGMYMDTSASKVYVARFLAAKKHLPSGETTNLFSKLAEKGRENEIVEFLRIIEPRLETLKVVTKGPGSFVYGQLKGAHRSYEIHLMGEGMEKLLNLILSIANAQDGIIFLDEIENGLHYTVLPKIWKALGQALRKYNCQLFASTHSYECLEAAYEGMSEIPEDFRYIRLDRKGDDISAKLLNYDMLGTAIKTNSEVR